METIQSAKSMKISLRNALEPNGLEWTICEKIDFQFDNIDPNLEHLHC